MKAKYTFICILLFICLFFEGKTKAFGGDLVFGIGFSGGISRLEGDFKKPQLSPLVSGHLRILPIPYFAFSGELGFSVLNTNDRRFFPDFKTTIIPFELSGIVNFLPFSKINPYIMAGGGGVYWKATNQGNILEDGIDSFLKTGGGLEFKVNKSFSLDLGATFRFSFTDAFDQLRQGDENDQVLDVHAGFTYYFRTEGNDKDNDFIPDELDLMPEIAEDHDGYLDHDGIPEKNPNPLDESKVGFVNDASPPIVIHHLINKAESGHSIPVKAHVFSNIDLRVVAILFRTIGSPDWNVIRMQENGDNLYQGTIPGYAISTQGLEYCVVAVDETLRGIGYSGLPSMPVRVKVSSSGKLWRIVGGSLGAATIGTSSYLILRKQK